MNTRTLFLIFLGLACSVTFAAGQAASPAAPAPHSPAAGTTGSEASESSIRQLLVEAGAKKLVETMMTQMDGFMKQAMQQATQGQAVSPKIQKEIDRRQAEVMTILKEELAWDKLEPMYIRVYQKSFAQQEIDGLIAFYKTPTGQALLQKMPVVMQNTLNEMQQRMNPMIQRIQKMQKDVIAEIQAEKKAKPAGG